MSYAELHCLSNFSFLRGASHPHELVAQAASLGYEAIAITDECSLAGIVRAWKEAHRQAITLIYGAEFLLEEGLHLVLLVTNRTAYSQLCSLISKARLNSVKGEYRLNIKDLSRSSQDCLAIWHADIASPEKDFWAGQLLNIFPGRLWLGFSAQCQQQVEAEYLSHYQLATEHKIPMVACGNILMHTRQRKPLQDVLTATRLKTPISELGSRLESNSEAYLKPLERLQQFYPEALLAESCRIAQRCAFKLDELSYQYPEEAVPKGADPSTFLRDLTLQGAAKRWPNGTPPKVLALIDKELSIIAKLGYEHYFLTVHDIVEYARSQHILCQGRGSAANSAVCYCLHITEVDPARGQLLFERFISEERKEQPDIDVDFEHERREEVFQYIYRKYGRSHAALTATVITYRLRSAMRDAGRAMGLDDGFISTLANTLAWWDKPEHFKQRLAEANLDLQGLNTQQFVDLVNQLKGFPRHLSQHVGGFVISRDPIATLVPQENAAMPNRTLIQWDKEDLESMRMMKVDILALGMLSALRKSLAYISGTLGYNFRLQDIPAQDPGTYDMLCQADSIGVFQVESRAQMSMLPRLQPREFYDLVIQIAIVRPGPIQGGMVHPYLRRRQGLEDVEYENPAIEKVLSRTLGISIFQEQVIQLAMVAAGFSGGEADQLRRAMASWGRNGDLEKFRDKLVNGMLKNGYRQDYAERIFSQMKGFGAYGFPESHSASFALLAYASAWIKRHYPAEFFCGLLNSLPMGFYSPSQLCQDARRHNVDVRPLCINHSTWDHQLEYNTHSPALRLGFRLLKGFNQESAHRICRAREQQFFHSITDFYQRCGLSQQHQQQLLHADAFHCFDGHRYQNLWQWSGIHESGPLFVAEVDRTDRVALPSPTEHEDICNDYHHTGLSLRRHPVSLLRQHPAIEGCEKTSGLNSKQDGSYVSVAGLVTCRQRPGTASGVLFVTLEDEAGHCNVVIWTSVQQAFRKEILTGRLLKVSGRLQINRQNTATPVTHVIAMQIEAHNTLLNIEPDSHDFH